MSRPIQLTVGVVAMAVAVVGVVVVRNATMTTHTERDPRSRVVIVVDATTNRAESTQTLQEMTEALLTLCRLEVTSDPTGPVRALDDDPTRFRIELQPALDTSNRRQYEGCVEDWRLDHLRLRVISMTDVEAS